jgi:hypothetical protein
MSGIRDERFAVVAPIAFSDPARTSGSTEIAGMHAMSMSPARSARTTSPDPW